MALRQFAVAALAAVAVCAAPLATKIAPVALSDPLLFRMKNPPQG